MFTQKKSNGFTPKVSVHLRQCFPQINMDLFLGKDVFDDSARVKIHSLHIEMA